MRRTFLYLAAWLAAGVAAVALASIGVSMVGRQVTRDRPPPLSAEEVRSELESGDAQSTVSTATTVTLPPDAASTTVPPAVDGEPSPGADGSPSPTSSPRATTAPGSIPVRSGATTTTAPQTTASETRSYTLVGGSATLRFSPSGVTVVAASPNPGYSVEMEATHDNGVRVRFETEGHESEVIGWWDGGPRDEVSEEN